MENFTNVRSASRDEEDKLSMNMQKNQVIDEEINP